MAEGEVVDTVGVAVAEEGDLEREEEVSQDGGNKQN
jgi:hypothetical protein